MAWPKLTKNASFGPNLVVFGQKILFFTGEIKSFVTYITENPPRHLVHIGFWLGIGQNVKKMAIFGPKWPKMQILDQILAVFGPKILNFMGVSICFGTHVMEKSLTHLVPIVFWNAVNSSERIFWNIFISDQSKYIQGKGWGTHRLRILCCQKLLLTDVFGQSLNFWYNSACSLGPTSRNFH